MGVLKRRLEAEADVAGGNGCASEQKTLTFHVSRFVATSEMEKSLTRLTVAREYFCSVTGSTGGLDVSRMLRYTSLL